MFCTFFEIARLAMSDEYLSPAIAAASRDAESFTQVLHIPPMIPGSKCKFLEILADPPVDHDVDSVVKSELNNH